MNEKYLRGYQKGTVDCLCFGIDFMKGVIEDLNSWDEFTDGFIKAIEMFENNNELMEEIKESLK